jgi:3-hydroxyisobutyrate dehydrogenase-like beta-hydroxyacid dehydrogenase
VSEVTLIGLGNMGSALARALIENKRSVTVWNRTPEKATILVEKGAVLAANAPEAVAVSPVIILCVTNYTVAQAILYECATSIPGKLLVQLSSGRPQEARAGETWAQHHQVEYLEGKITGSPSSIGTPDAHLLLSGPEAVFHKAQPLLLNLAARLDYKGASIGLASAWDSVMILRYFGMFLSLFHSIQICEAEGISLEEYSTLLGEQGKGYEQWLCDNIRSDSYAETSAPLELWANAIQFIAEHAQESRIHAGFPLFTAALFQEAMDAGYGREEVSALYKILSRASGSKSVSTLGAARTPSDNAAS